MQIWNQPLQWLKRYDLKSKDHIEEKADYFISHYLLRHAGEVLLYIHISIHFNILSRQK
jgi:hypothetical protein